MKYVFLVNKFSLGTDIEDIIKRINGVSKRLKLDYVIETNSTDLSTEDILKKYSNSRNIIFAIGGDGTLNRVLNGIVGTENVLGFIPYGTGNDFYKASRELLEQGINKIDLVKINEKYFINIACFGIDADIANESDIIHSKIIPKSQRYNIGVLYHFWKYNARSMEVLIADEDIKQEFTTVAVCNARYYGGGYKIGTHSSLNDGLVDVYLADKLDRMKMAKLILSMKNGDHERANEIRKFRTNKLVIKSDKEVASNIDGEELTAKEFNIEVIPDGVEVFYNQELIDGISRVRK